jgi:hypothetical protein
MEIKRFCLQTYLEVVLFRADISLSTGSKSGEVFRFCLLLRILQTTSRHRTSITNAAIGKTMWSTFTSELLEERLSSTYAAVAWDRVGCSVVDSSVVCLHPVKLIPDDVLPHTGIWKLNFIKSFYTLESVSKIRALEVIQKSIMTKVIIHFISYRL